MKMQRGYETIKMSDYIGGHYYPGGVYSKLVGAVGVVPIVTGFIRWCPAYIPFGFSTCELIKNKKKGFLEVALLFRTVLRPMKS